MVSLFRRDRPGSPADDEGALPTPVDPLAGVDRGVVPPRLLPTVDVALACAGRYRTLVATRPEGPVRDRIASIGARVDQGVVAVYDAARQAAHLDALAATLDAEAATAAYKDARRRGAPPELVETHRARFESVQRILNTRDELDGRLELLVARLEAAVARVAELTVVATADAEGAEHDLADVTDELTALRAGLEALT